MLRRVGLELRTRGKSQKLLAIAVEFFRSRGEETADRNDHCEGGVIAFWVHRHRCIGEAGIEIGDRGNRLVRIFKLDEKLLAKCVVTSWVADFDCSVRYL